MSYQVINGKLVKIANKTSRHKQEVRKNATTFAPVVKDNQPDKGKYGGSCNLTACQKPASANWYNHSTHKYYCYYCATNLNEYNRDTQELFGWNHELCTEGKACDTCCWHTILRPTKVFHFPVKDGFLLKCCHCGIERQSVFSVSKPDCLFDYNYDKILSDLAAIDNPYIIVVTSRGVANMGLSRPDILEALSVCEEITPKKFSEEDWARRNYRRGTILLVDTVDMPIVNIGRYKIREIGRPELPPLPTTTNSNTEE